MILRPVARHYSQSSEYQELTGAEKPAIEGISPASFSLIVAARFLDTKKQLLVVTSSPQKARDLLVDMTCFLDEEELFYIPPWETLPYENISPPEQIQKERITSLYSLIARRSGVYITTVESVSRYLPSPESLTGKGVELMVNEEYDVSSLSELFVSFGYSRENRVESFGQFAIKGGIMDIFPPGSPNPLRFDFFGDTLESIRLFSPVSQISLESLEETVIYPRREILLTDDQAAKLTKKLSSMSNDNRELPHWHDALHKDAELLGIEDYFSLVSDSSLLWSYLHEESEVILCDPMECKTNQKNLVQTFEELHSRKTTKHVIQDVDKLIDDSPFEKIERPVVTIQTYSSSPNALRWALKTPTSYRGQIKEARKGVAEYRDEGWTIILTTAFEGQARRISDLFLDQHGERNFELLDDTPLNVVISPLNEGCEIHSIKTVILTDHEIFGKSYRKNRTFKKKSSRPIDSFLELQEGDYVVHINHGIGVFQHIERMSAGGVERDFLKIKYQGDDTLFVPLDQITMVQKYIGLEGKDPRVDVLGKKSAWNRIKKKVQESVEEIASQLVKIYSQRTAHRGFRFPPDTQWQEEFEALFEYEETPDQIAAIEDVKDDMESDRPMDRLVCGDVGFGKTEVAIRSAFKAVMAGRQVAVLVPTTVLAMQHYNTFSTRFKGYPIEIDTVSRFRTQGEIRKIGDRLAKGEIDIVIGTHALFSKTITIKNFGLLIIDEEQKFGVRHKEELKKMRALVDVLTLSATPIPRTLHMSMASIRDLTIIATPPENRQSIETYVMEDNPDILRRAILRELARDGQVFFVHNRVQTIDVQAAMLEELVPEANLRIAHGQMNKHELEEIILDFINKKFDILLSTTIIESGLDMPNVNTIIIHRADTFGLSQLYQLKGRVGRSDKKGYAYLFYPPHMSLTEEAQKRLQVISEYTELGSGFRVAMKDLEIRGAGNIIGHEQSGSIMEVGFDLYTSMLEDAVKKARGEKPKDPFRTPVYVKTDFYIPDDYIEDNSQKIEFYKRFEACETGEEVDELVRQMEDRFGTPPDIVLTLVELEHLRVEASQLLIEEVLEDSRYIRFRITGNSTVNGQNLVTLIQNDSRLSFDPQDPEVLRFNLQKLPPEKKILEVKNFLQQLS